MKRHRVFAGVSLCLLALAALALPTVASAQLTAYQAVIQAKNSSSGASLGYVTRDPNYWTPLFGPDINNALLVDFTLNGQTGTGIDLTTSPIDGFTYFGLIQGRDSTSPDIGVGNFNYLYMGPTNPTPANSTPLDIGNQFTVATGMHRASESAVWTVDVSAKTLVPVWVNSDGTTPTTQVFVQSNHLYGGGDANAFHARFPAPVTVVTLHLEILSAVPLDADGDGIPDESDSCPGTPAGEVVNANGCSIAQLCPCENQWKYHGVYVACVVKSMGPFVQQHLITVNEAVAVVVEAVRAACGR